MMQLLVYAVFDVLQEHMGQPVKTAGKTSTGEAAANVLQTMVVGLGSNIRLLLVTGQKSTSFTPLLWLQRTENAVRLS
jgi:hypothetical protein